jgi:hypothetical protein
MTLTREDKQNVGSAMATLAGIGLAVAGSEVAAPLVMAAGAGLVAATAIGRVIGQRTTNSKESPKEENNCERVASVHR